MNVIAGSQETDVACPKAKLSQPSGKCAGVHRSHLESGILL